ncbi:XRE family transcriptional regulator [Nocardiopsis xinjiangensis]|uniref:XRE family transcriptional regulator n=1 Tax=Nocardiopsis xinjiangensis TaxID=124285 RepID=UPI001F4CB13A|nr:XRE family transcriptional regulator [Nocardiopsis xinjiangensis]
MNAALRKALAASRLTETDVAAHIGVDPKTVRRWLSGTRPYPRHRWAVADLLQVEEEALWPEKSHQSRTNSPAPEHTPRVYAHRWQVPREVWWNLFNSADQEIGILAYSALFLADDMGILELLTSQARKGVSVRIILGDPESHPVEKRGRDEGIGEILPARARNSLFLFREFMTSNRVDVRTHSTALYCSIFLTEKTILANQHIYGLPAARAPVLEIEREPLSELSKIYTSSFEKVWSDSRTLN